MTISTERGAAELQRLADALHEAEQSLSPISPPTSLIPGLTVDDAYRVQRSNLQRRLVAGERIVGRKVGLTSLAMQRQLGVDQPDFGTITDRMVIPDGGVVDMATLIAPKVEAEFAFRVGSDVALGAGRDDLVTAIDGVAVALEIIDSRVQDWRITLPDTVADNASSARMVYGGFRAATPGLLAGLPSQKIQLDRDGVSVAVGPGSAVLGDPLVSLGWLLTAIGAYGDDFRAGDVVLAGAVAASVPLTAGSAWTARASGFPPVRLHSLPEGR